MNYLDDVKDKRQSQANKSQSDMMLQMALANSQKKPSIILTDSTDLGEHIAELGNKIVEVLEAVVDDKNSTAQIDRITDLLDEYKALSNDIKQSSQEHSEMICDAIADLKKAVTAVKPPVVIPAPEVNLNEKEVDLKPLIKKIEQLMKKPEKSISMGDFRAQDMDNEGSLQYIGFTSMDDTWYIMLNDTTGNTMRYIFGRGNYAKAWDDRHNYEYGVLNEAINAIRS